MKAGIPFYVCPGTSSWNSIGGRTENMLANIINAAVNGYKQGAIGLLCTDWGDNGHYQPTYITSYLGFLAAAEFSWNSHSEKNIKDMLSYPYSINIAFEILQILLVKQFMNSEMHTCTFLIHILMDPPFSVYYNLRVKII